MSDALRVTAQTARENVAALVRSLDELKRGQGIMAEMLFALVAERDQLRAAMTAMTARAEAAEQEIAAVPVKDIDLIWPLASFPFGYLAERSRVAAWLAAQSEVQP